MSSIEVSKVLDPRIDVSAKREYVITKGGSKVSYIPYKTQSTGNSTMSFSVIPPSRQTFVGRKAYVQTSITIEFTATCDTGNTLIGSIVESNFDAPRSFPLSRALGSASATIGNVNTSMQSSDVIDTLLRLMPVGELKDYQDGCPTALDRLQTYEAGVLTGTSGINVLGNNSQAILSTGEYARGYYNVRVLPVARVGTTTVYKQSVSFDVYEPVLLSPFVFSKINHSGYLGLQNISLVYNFSNNINELVWSGTQPLQTTGAPPVVSLVTNIIPIVSFSSMDAVGSASSVSNAQLWVGYISPSTLMMDIPRNISYNYYQVERFLSNGFSDLRYGETTTVISNNIQLKCVPNLILLGVRKTKQNQRYYDPDCYYSIEKASINFDNGVGLLSSASQFDLYQISKKNGINYNFNEWSGQFVQLGAGNANNSLSTFTLTAGDTTTYANIPAGTGSLLVLKPSEDLGLDDNKTDGILGSFNLQAQLSVRCINPRLLTVASKDYEMFIITVNGGSLDIDLTNGDVSTKIGLVSERDALETKISDKSYYSTNQLVGGDFISSLSNIGRKIGSVVKSIAPVIHMASDALKSTGAGVGFGLVGSGRGGRISSKKSLKDRLL